MKIHEPLDSDLIFKNETMKTKEYIYCIIIVLLICILLRVDYLNKKEDSKTLPTEIKLDNCIPITISGAGTQDLRAKVNLKFDVVVCENERGQAIINNSFNNFKNDIIAENKEWK